CEVVHTGTRFFVIRGSGVRVPQPTPLRTGPTSVRQWTSASSLRAIRRLPRDAQLLDFLSNAIPGLIARLVAFCFEFLCRPPSHLARDRSVARLKETRVYFNSLWQRNPHGSPTITKKTNL